VLSMADVLAETIDAIQNHTSVSRVYDRYDDPTPDESPVK